MDNTQHSITHGTVGANHKQYMLEEKDREALTSLREKAKRHEGIATNCLSPISSIVSQE